MGTADFEIVLGFAAPIGTDLDVLVGPLQDELRIYGYDSEEIRLSRLLDVAPDNPDSVDYYTDRMDAGDALRKRAGSGDVLAALAVGKIVTDRLPDEPNRRFAWLLRTLKHKDEVALLRHAYGKRFVLIGVHQGQQRRQRNLVASLRDESPGGTNHAAAVENLMRRDENDLENEFGQHGRNVFASADYLVDLDRDVSTETSRMVGLLFGEPFRTPSRDEVGMAHAFTAAARSADPGRQVGAAITLESGELLTTGSNEVPKSGGGEYWSGDAPDGRDFAEGYDFNKRQTRRTLREVLTSLEAGGVPLDGDGQPYDRRPTCPSARLDRGQHQTDAFAVFDRIRKDRARRDVCSVPSSATWRGCQWSNALYHRVPMPHVHAPHRG